LFGRLLAAVGIGLALLTSCGSRSLCLALTWYLQPLLGKRAWRAGLSAALVVRFLPRVFALTEQTGRQIRLRLLHVGVVGRFSLLSRAVLRQLAQKSWNQSVALVARRLARPEAWVMAGRPEPRAVLGVLAAGAACIGLLYV
jgi:biotin transport system permease protein